MILGNGNAPPEDPLALGDKAPLEDPLALADAGPRAVRGGAIRVTGYVAGSALAAGSSVLLLRYLGVADFGRYAAVISLVGVITGLSDGGLSLVGQREYVLQPTEQLRRELTADILGIRLLITPIAVALATLFSVLAGYSEKLVLGTLVACSSLLFTNIALTLSIPLTSQLRFGAVTASEVGRQVVVVGGNVLFVVLGTQILPFFVVQVVASCVASITVAFLLGRRFLMAPRFSVTSWAVILRQAAPMGAAVIIAALYLRTLVVLSSLLTTAFQTGLFATSYRVLEILVGLPALMVGSAFPIMAKSGLNDDERLSAVLQQLLETTMLLAVMLVIVLVIGAEPIVRIIGGGQYASAGPVLRIQSFALLGSFASVIWTMGLIAIRHQAALIVINICAFASVIGVGIGVIPALGAEGAAIAAVVGEALLATSALVMLARARPRLRPNLRFIGRLLPGAALGCMCALVPGVPALAAAAAAALVYATGAFVCGAVPPGVTEALRSWTGGGR